MKDIVLVHSNEKLSNLYHQKLGKYFKVQRAFDGIMGLRLIRHTQPNMVITEYELPWLSGIGLLKFIRKHPTISAIPVIIISAQDPDQSALKWGANEWIKPKEVTLDQMLQKIFNYLSINA
jgi:two-component system, chemotaxis family, chemotaxis protein CheY